MTCRTEESDAPREACGLFGACGQDGLAQLCHHGLFALQHRGQESAGIAASQGGSIQSHVGMGLVPEVFRGDALERLSAGADAAIGHVRYSTTGRSVLQNAQPLVVRCGRGPIAIAHNGNLTNSKALRDALERKGSIFQGTTDSEVILHLYAQPVADAKSVEDHLLWVLRQLEGAYSLLLLLPGTVVAARDPHGWRPLWIGRLPSGAPVFASETCALDLCGAQVVREVRPGEAVFARGASLDSLTIAAETPAHCIFEHVYFARPDSIVFGDSVYEVRKRLGRRLAEEQPAEADLVIPIPDSGTPAALGYAEGSRLPFELGLVRSHYVGRTFLHPSSARRREGVNLKLAPVRSVIEGKRLVVVDDSIVRGTTARSRVRLLFENGAREVHFRVSCPPIRHPCFFGIDFPDPSELIARERSPAEIARSLGATSVGYLSLEGLLGAVTRTRESYCTACYSGRYPIVVRDAEGKLIHEEVKA